MRLSPWPPTVRVRLTLWYTSVLLAILLIVSGLSYALLRRSLMQDVDASLQIVGQVVRDTGYSPTGGKGSGPEAAVRDLLGPQFYDAFFQLVDPHGGPGPASSHAGSHPLPLSETTRRNAAEGRPTFETIQFPAGEPIRLVTMPILQDGRVVQLVQVGTSLRDTEQTLLRYLEALLVLVPLGLVLATAGGMAIARAALRPVADISRTARRITAEDLSLRVPRRFTGDELDHLVETLNAMLSRLDDAFVQMQRFATDAAHELRTPLTVLTGGIEVALRTPRPADEYRRVLQSSLEEVRRLVRLAEDLLFLARTSTDIGSAVGPARDRVELEPVVLDVLDMGTRLAHGVGVSLRLADCVPAVVVGNAADLRRALLNLVENAVKYTPAGGTVELALTQADRSASIVVRDTGPGIEPADADRIFQPFVRLDVARARDTGGSGLGLAITRSIVLAHGGTITVDSTPGAGSQFTIRLPLADNAPADPEASPPHVRSASSGRETLPVGRAELPST
jgi:heavy metal sensor kinase